jgi:hypothetical protein
MSRLRHPIRSLKEPFGKAGLTVAILALVLAMVGGAWAAASLNSKQKKEVTKIAKKYAGAPGAAGTNGINGTQGPAGIPGAKGDKGEKGDTGAKGDTGTSGNDGANGVSVSATEIPFEEPECEERGGVLVQEEGAPAGVEICNGEEGSPWTAGGTLPPGKTEMGQWSLSVPPPSPTLNNGQSIVIGDISFVIPLATVPNGIYLKEAEVGVNNTAECPGTAEHPEAAAGVLCVYTLNEIDATATSPIQANPSEFGAILATLHATKPGGVAWGSWAVTAGP